MQASTQKQLVGKIRKSAETDQLGEAACPHCNYYQRFMVRNSWKIQSSIFGGLGFFIGGIFAFLYGYLAPAYPPSALSLIVYALCGAIPCGLLGMIAGYFAKLRLGPHPADTRSTSDDGMVTFLNEIGDDDPAVVWWTSRENYPNGKHPQIVGLGIKDETGEAKFPLELSTQEVLPRVLP